MSDTLPIIYLGPTSPKLGLVRLHQYLSLNPHIKAAIAKHPVMNLLFVPLEEFHTRAQTVYANKDASIQHAILSLTKAGVL